jgi:protein CrcB
MTRISGHTLSTRRRLLAVLAGGFLGTLARAGLSLIFQSWWGNGWPIDILLINVSGALLLALVTILADTTFLVGPTRRLFLTTGLLGAYTTFSSLALGEVLLLDRAAWLAALGYMVLSLLGGMAAVLVGNQAGQIVVARLRHRAGLPSVRREGQQAEKAQADQRDLLSSPRRPE